MLTLPPMQMTNNNSQERNLGFLNVSIEILAPFLHMATTKWGMELVNIYQDNRYHPPLALFVLLESDRFSPVKEGNTIPLYRASLTQIRHELAIEQDSFTEDNELEISMRLHG